jgi:gp16 family phage-associated protein
VFTNLPSSSLQRLRDQFVAEGVTVRGWAVREGFDVRLVYQVLAGRVAGRRGKSHEIAVRLGLKPAVEVPQLRQPTEVDQ